MTCKKFRILLSAYLDGEIKKEEEKKLLEHLKTCSGCSKELEYLKQTKKMFLLKERKEPQEFFETRLFERIKNREEQPKWQAYFPAFKKAVPVFLVFFLLIFGLVKYKKFFYSKGGVTSDLLVDAQTEENFEEELLEIYYGPLG